MMMGRKMTMGRKMFRPYGMGWHGYGADNGTNHGGAENISAVWLSLKTKPPMISLKNLIFVVFETYL